MPYSSKDVAKTLNISESTARLWAKQFDIPKRKSNRAIYPDEAMDVFKMIKELRDKDAGLQTIKRVIGKSDSSNNESVNASQLGSTEALNTQLTDQIKDTVQDTVNTALQTVNQVLADEFRGEMRNELARNNELAEKYSKASYMVGQLEERVRVLEEQKTDLQSELKLLPLPHEIKDLQVKTVDQASEIDELRKQIETLESELDTEKKRTWWQRLWKKEI